jgi:hypothetical protein
LFFFGEKGGRGSGGREKRLSEREREREKADWTR